VRAGGWLGAWSVEGRTACVGRGGRGRMVLRWACRRCHDDGGEKGVCKQRDAEGRMLVGKAIATTHVVHG
jgi:hypothetical protein